MEFICYYSFHELPLNNGDYNTFADREVYGYQYNLDGDYHLAVLVEDDYYAVFRTNEEEIANIDILEKAHEITRFYRETKGAQTRHLTANTIRKIETQCRLYTTNEQIENSEILNTANLCLEKKHSISANGESWHIAFNGIPLVLLNSEYEIGEIFDIICCDITAYVLQRWRRILR